MIDEKISILVPTRDRPKFVNDLIESVKKTAFNLDQIEFVFYVDNDDQKTINFLEKKIKQSEVKIIFTVGERIVLSEMWNICHSFASGTIFNHCGDDLRFRTKNWDKIVRNKFSQFEDRIAFIYGRDGIQPKSFGTHGFIHKNWVDTVGYFVPPFFSSDYNDTWLNEVAELVDRKFYIPIYTEHLHPDAGKHFWDKTHLERKERGKKDDVEKLWLEKKHLRIEDAQKLKQFISDFREQK